MLGATTTDGEKETVSQSTAVHITKQEKSMQAGRGGWSQRFVLEMVAAMRSGGHEKSRKKVG